MRKFALVSRINRRSTSGRGTAVAPVDQIVFGFPGRDAIVVTFLNAGTAIEATTSRTIGIDRSITEFYTDTAIRPNVVGIALADLFARVTLTRADPIDTHDERTTISSTAISISSYDGR